MRWFVLMVGFLWGQALADAPLQLRDLDGKLHAPFQHEETKAVVVVFVSTDCPIANYFQPTLRHLQDEFSEKGVRFYQVHPDPETPRKDARTHRNDFGLKCPVIIDEKQTVTKQLEATTTPEAFVLTKNGRVAYRGRIDDTYTDFGKRRPKPRTRDLREAIVAVVAGKEPAIAKTAPVGCRIFIEE